MDLDGALNDGETEAGAARPLGEKRLEDVRWIDRAETGPGVFDSAPDPRPHRVMDRSTANADHAPGRSVVNGILEQVLDGPRQARAIHEDQAQLRGEFVEQCDRLGRCE